jgi:hypothetical protein
VEREEGSHRAPDADLAPVAEFAKDLIEIENVGEPDAQTTPDLPVIVLQSEAHLQDALGGDALGGRLLASLLGICFWGGALGGAVEVIEEG